MYFQKIGNGKPIVFLHGWGCDGNVFLPIAKQLTDYKCYLVDFNGFGKSPAPSSMGWTVEDYAAALAIFFRQHNLQHVCIVAHSFGGRVALVFAAKYPRLVSKLLLVAPAGLRSFSFSRWCKVRRYKLQKLLRKTGCAKGIGRSFGSADYNACDEKMKNTFVKVVNQDLSSFVKQVTCTALIVNGKQDTATPLKHARRLQRLLKNSSLTEIEGGHFAFFEKPNAFAETVRYFMEV